MPLDCLIPSGCFHCVELSGDFSRFWRRGSCSNERGQELSLVCVSPTRAARFGPAWVRAQFKRRFPISNRRPRVSNETRNVPPRVISGSRLPHDDVDFPSAMPAECFADC